MITIELLKLYKLTLESKNFQVSLNFERTKYYTTLNVALLAGSMFLLDRTLSLTLSALGFVSSLFTVWIIVRGHEYYRNCRRRTLHAEIAMDLNKSLSLSTVTDHGESFFRDKVTIVSLTIVFQIILAGLSIFSFLERLRFNYE